jgi:hypothetical protein
VGGGAGPGRAAALGTPGFLRSMAERLEAREEGEFRAVAAAIRARIAA